MESGKKGHAWTFARIGGVDQVVLSSFEDIEHIKDLDHKLWAALSMPVSRGKYRRTLDILDSDHDGKVRIADILDAVEFLKSSLRTLEPIMSEGDSLSLAFIKNQDIASACGNIFKILEVPASESITLGQASEAIDRFGLTAFNGDGVVPPASTCSEILKRDMKDIIGAGYGSPDLCGEMGLDTSALDVFFTNAAAVLEWWKKPRDEPSILPFGERTEPLYTAMKSVRDKIDDYFLRCHMFALSPTAEMTERIRSRISDLISNTIGLESDEAESLPLALPNADISLCLDEAMHPMWENKVKTFLKNLGKPAILERGKMTETDWSAIKAEFSDFDAWTAATPTFPAAFIGVDRLAEIVEGNTETLIRELIGEDIAKAPYLEHFREVEKLLLLRCDLLHVLGNFINFDEFYLRGDGIFQSGRLFIDGRELELCFDVSNIQAHANLATLSAIYLIYCDLLSKEGAKKTIVAALTQGSSADADSIFAGRNGVFIDIDDKAWDAVITKVIIQPISIREAFFSPYKWLVKTIEDLATKRAASAENASMGKMKTVAETAVASVEKPSAKPAGVVDQSIVPKKIDVGTVAAIGVALGSIGAMVTGILGVFFGMGAWMPLGIVAVILLISGPSMILAWLKLRRRNIGPLLNAEGWAINSKLKINIPFGASLSHLAKLPAGSIRLVKDPFAEKKRPWKLYLGIAVVVLILLGWIVGWFNPILPTALQVRTILGLNA
jgi:hypothetical protein